MSPSALGRTIALVLVVGCLAFASLRALTSASQERQRLEAVASSPLARIFEATNFANLPADEARLVEFLLLLPVAGLVIAVFRNVIGLPSFGTFAPVLIGLAFRHLDAWPGVLAFVTVLLVGWGLRRALEPLHLLEVPRASLLLSIVVVGLIGVVTVGHVTGVSVAAGISLFPLVILTGIIERLWATETEDGPWVSFLTLLGTLAIAASVSLVLAIPGLVAGLLRFPELIGLFMAGQLLLGRYTGYRLSELYRFRELADEPGPVILQVRRTVASQAKSHSKASLENTCHSSLDKTSAMRRGK